MDIAGENKKKEYKKMPSVNMSDSAIEQVGESLLNTNAPLASRFRALFTLKNIGGEIAVKSIERCFRDKSALLKHECAYCLGQMKNHPGATGVLTKIVQDQSVEVS